MIVSLIEESKVFGTKSCLEILFVSIIRFSCAFVLMTETRKIQNIIEIKNVRFMSKCKLVIVVIP